MEVVGIAKVSCSYVTEIAPRLRIVSAEALSFGLRGFAGVANQAEIR